MIEHLLRTTAEQSRKYESLKAAMDRSEDLDGNRDSTLGRMPATPDLDAGTIPREVPSKSRTIRLLEAPEMDPTTTRSQNYYTLMEHLMAEVEAEDYNIEPDVRRRIRDDVIRTHQRETGFLRADHGHTDSKEKTRDNSWRPTEMAEDQADKGEQAQIQQWGARSSGAILGPFPSDAGAQLLDSDLCYSSPETIPTKQMEGCEGSPAKVHMTAVDGVHVPEISAIKGFLDDREDPWNHFHLLFDAPLIDKPRAAEENGWLPYWRSGISTRALHRILPLNPLKAQVPFLRACTSMLVTEKSHDVETTASSQDLAALTDSTDTDSYVSARSELGEAALDTQLLCQKEAEKDGPLVVLGDQRYGDPAGEDDGTLGLGIFDPTLDELLAA